MQNPEVFRPRSSYGFAAVIGVIAAGFTAESVLVGGSWDIAATVVGSLGLLWAGYTVFLRPKVEISNEGLVITNMVATEVVGWQDVISIDTKYCMSVKTPAGEVFAVAAPAPGRYHARTVHASELKGLQLGSREQLRPGDSPRSHSGVAAQLAKQRWTAFVEAGRTDGLVRSRSLNPWGAIAPTLLLAAALLMQLVHG